MPTPPGEEKPRLLARCEGPHGEHWTWPTEARETSCVDECDCVPSLYIRVPEGQVGVVLTRGHAESLGLLVEDQEAAADGEGK